jgi:hypothetical protein
MHYLSIGAIVKNEALYLEEWLEFHLLRGVEHFYLFDNMSTDNTKDIIRPYVDAGLMDAWLIEDMPRVQFIAYDKILCKYEKESRWIAFIDADEFLFSPVHPDIKEIIKRYEGYSAVAVHWIMFGSSGELHYTPELVTRRFTKRAAQVNRHVKSIVQPSQIVGVDADPHTFVAHGTVCNERKQVLGRHYALEEGGTANLLRINHYSVKSLEETRTRWKLRDPGSGANRGGTPEAFDIKFKDQDRNEVEDYSLYSMANTIEAKIKERRAKCP